MKPQATIIQVLMAVALSEMSQKTHVLFMPPGKEYTKTLKRCKIKGYIKPMGENYYTVTKIGYQYLNLQKKSQLAQKDKEIDDFVDSL